MTPIRKALLAAVSTLAIAGPALAECTSVTFSDVGWTDITVTTSATRQVLEALGYEVEVDILGVPVTYASMDKGDVDVFLGTWLPAQQGAIGPYLEKGTIEEITTNLEGTKYTLAVPSYLYDKGLQSYADIGKFKDELGGKIYGIEPGNEGNEYLISLTEAGKPLEGFEIVQSSEQGMLAQVSRFYPQEKGVVFLGWEPHPMNATFALKYLPGGEAFFGEEGVVKTMARKGFKEECPNVAKLLSQQTFTLPMENEIMGKILDDGMDPDEAVLEWLKAHPETVDPWLAGVTTRDGAEALAAVKQTLGL
ncbi:glycine betaine/proline transport system substrate-binding protein [Cereibacter ovatus]|uniref:Glycine betaine/proline transport system substrate-binding protein n=1 Tax=Cereibacter ovatus TaxID=439529 RepID=A0A285CII1_9RHOB|nr:choline ABC transporter substrate-binding protein [Cereibacter ovatus]SNX67402.1 glycine betaine/proline transport system substrate-binding protein [Cereibacter ovatus]